MKISSLLSPFLLVLALASMSAQAAALPDAARFSVTIERGDLAQAREWLEAGLPPDFEGSRIGSGIMIGAWEGNIPMMEAFLARGADINKVNSLGEQALLHAAWKGHFAAVRWLVEHGARLNREGKQWAALHYASFAGHDDVVGLLLERGADVNALSVNGSTALMMAAREGKDTIASRLLASGAKRDIANDWGDSAVTWAMRNNNVKIAREIATSTQFELAVKAQTASPVAPIRSQPLPDRVDKLLAQARKLEDAGLRKDALRLYRAAWASIRRAEPKKALGQSSGTPTRILITARRGQPGEQTAQLNYATPATEASPSQVGNRSASTLKAASSIGAPSTAARTEANPGTPDLVEDWLSRARDLEAAGRRAEALTAYREASKALRSRP